MLSVPHMHTYIYIYVPFSQGVSIHALACHPCRTFLACTVCFVLMDDLVTPAVLLLTFASAACAIFCRSMACSALVLVVSSA